MTDRQNKIFLALPSCEVFADVGCDHGYLANAMLKSGKCKRAIISDISAKCLKKAEELLSEYIEKGVVESAVSNGFDNISKSDLALIAGMGGEEIVAIMERAFLQDKLPEKLVLQPMKNCDKVRVTALKLGYAIEYDKVFKSARKYYNLIVLKRGSDTLTQEEIEFGRDNLRELHQDFTDMLKDTLGKLTAVLEGENLSEEVRNSVQKRVDKIKKYV